MAAGFCVPASEVRITLGTAGQGAANPSPDYDLGVHRRVDVMFMTTDTVTRGSGQDMHNKDAPRQLRRP